MVVTKEQIESVRVQMAAEAQLSADECKELIKCDGFTELVTSHLVLMMKMDPLTMLADAVLIRDAMAVVFVIGYKLGKQKGQADALEAMTKGE